MKNPRYVSRLVGNLFLSTCSEFYYDDITVTHVVSYEYYVCGVLYGDVTAESIPQGTLHVRLWRLWIYWD